MSIKAKKYMSYSMICLLAFVILAILSSLLSLMIYLAIIAAVICVYFFFSSLRFIGESDLFELIGSVFQRGSKPLEKPVNVTPPPPYQEVRCLKCGATMKAGANFCENCGANIKAT
jgi:divalent metal cation (Fe/Co/Zn/Cd) transporter